MKLIKFSATWCGPCKMQHREFESHPIDCELKEVDIDSEEGKELVPKYEIRSIPTMILLNDKEEVMKTWHGVTKSSEINEFIHRGEGTSN